MESDDPPAVAAPAPSSGGTRTNASTRSGSGSGSAEPAAVAAAAAAVPERLTRHPQGPAIAPSDAGVMPVGALRARLGFASDAHERVDAERLVDQSIALLRAYVEGIGARANPALTTALVLDTRKHAAMPDVFAAAEFPGAALTRGPRGPKFRPNALYTPPSLPALPPMYDVPPVPTDSDVAVHHLRLALSTATRIAQALADVIDRNEFVGAFVPHFASWWRVQTGRTRHQTSAPGNFLSPIDNDAHPLYRACRYAQAAVCHCLRAVLHILRVHPSIQLRDPPPAILGLIPTLDRSRDPPELIAAEAAAAAAATAADTATVTDMHISVVED